MAEKVTKLELVSGYKEEIIEILSELTTAATSGEIIEMVIITKRRDGFKYHQWTNCSDLYELIGNLDRMKYQTQLRLDERIGDGE